MLFKKREFVVKCNVGLNSDVHTTQIYYIHKFGMCYLREETLLSSAMLVGIVKFHIQQCWFEL